MNRILFLIPFRTPIIAGDELQTYTLTPATVGFQTSFPSSGIRHILLQPTDASGSEFELDSIRFIFRKEHLAGIPAGISWQGLSNVFRETLVTRSPEEVRFDLDLSERPWLDLAIGSVEDGPVRFRVAVERGDEETVVLERTVTTPHRWERAPVDLEAFSDEKVMLSLSLSSDKEGTLGFWGAPAVRHRGVMPAPRDEVPRVSNDPPQGVILILGDTLRKDHLDAYGYERETAPTLAKMASHGALFEDPISQATWTKVSVPSILTSLYPTAHGIVDFNNRVPAAAVTLAEVYREAGYATLATVSGAFAGHLTNLHQGFEEVHERASLDFPGSKSARAFADRLLPWLEAHKDVPFFVFYHVMDPHSPYEPARPYDSMWTEPGDKERHEELLEKVREFIKKPSMRRRGLPTRAQLEKAGIDPEEFVAHDVNWYDGSIRAMDAEIGRTLERLRQLGLEENTLIAFVSDHGEGFLDHGRPWHGNSLYGEMTNVPLILYRRGSSWAGSVIEETVQTIDLMPTLVELSRLPIPATLQGQSLVPLLNRGEGWRERPVVTELLQRPSRTENEPTDFEGFSMILDGWKLIHYTRRPPDHPEYQLFHHRKDPFDMDDLAAERPQIVEQLASKLEAWQRWAEASRLPSDEEAAESMSAEELDRLRSLGYVQ